MQPFVRDIPRSVLQMAQEILLRQPYVAASPGTREASGDYNYCVAAAIAVAGARLDCNTAAEKFVSEAIVARDKALLARAYEVLGWSPEVCGLALVNNDNADPAARYKVIERLFGPIL